MSINHLKRQGRARHEQSPDRTGASGAHSSTSINPQRRQRLRPGNAWVQVPAHVATVVDILAEPLVALDIRKALRTTFEFAAFDTDCARNDDSLHDLYHHYLLMRAMEDFCRKLDGHTL